MPPLVRGTWALIHPPSGPTRKATVEAISSGVPRHSIGFILAMRSTSSCDLPVREHIRRDRSRCHDIHGNVAAAKLLRQDRGHGFHRGPGCGIDARRCRRTSSRINPFQVAQHHRHTLVSISPSTSQSSSARVSTSVLLANGVSRLGATLKLTTAILALAAGVYTYLGVRELLNGSPTTVFFAAVIYSVAVSVGIYTFWVFLMQFMPHVVGRAGRGLMLGCMLLGSLMIVAMSSWLNASALAGAAAIQQHLAITVQNYTRDLDTANSNAIAAQGLLPDIQLASSRFAKLADAERAGSLTGTSGSGTVVQLLTQMSGQLDSLGQEVQASGKRVSALYEQGSKNLAKMRELISDRGPIAARSDAFPTESLALMGVIANLQP